MSVVYESFKVLVLPRIKEILTLPIHQNEMLWIITPLIISLVLLHLYFAHHREEKFGWNEAYGNSIVLIFVTLHLTQYMNKTYGLYQVFNDHLLIYKGLFTIAIVLLALILVFAEFAHKLPKKFALLISSTTFINFMAFMAIIVVYSNIIMDKYTLLAFLTILIGLIIIIKIIRYLTPVYMEGLEALERQKELRKEKIILLEERVKNNIKQKKDNMINGITNHFKK